jgi:hypothetical protein
MNRKRIRNLIVAIALTFAGAALHPVTAARADAAWHVLFNGIPSETALVDTEAGHVVPVSFNVPPASHRQQYSVWIETDPSTMQVKVTRVLKQAPVRGPGDCRFCNGSKKCPDCYPPGSKVNTAGLPCIACNATGECTMCHGSGVCYTCGGRGFETGCPDCSKVLAQN